MCLDYKKVILPLLTVLWMGTIFWFSSAPAEESAEMSLLAGMKVGKLVVPGFEEWTTREQESFAEKIDYPVRKTAHAGEYALLGMLMAGTLGAFHMTGIKMGIIAWTAATLYAATDEFHQLFVPGRSGQPSDVMLDSAGAAAGVLVYAIASYIISRKTRCCGRNS